MKKGANSRKRSPSQPRAKLENKVLKYWKTSKTLFEIAKSVGCRQPTVKYIYIKYYGIMATKKRSNRLYSRSKLGTKNPMFNKCGKKHHLWKGNSLDHKGYKTVIKPKWWTGKNKTRIFEHHYIYAKNHKITYIPKGYHIHHVDGNGLNNDITNLRLMKASEHLKMHHSQKRVTTSRKT